MTRDTIAKRLRAAGVVGSGTRAGNSTYRLRDAVPAIMKQVELTDDGEIDPTKLAPRERADWYKSELSRVELETRQRLLIRAADVESEMAEIVRGMVQFLESLPDRLERDIGLSHDQVEAMYAAVSEYRGELHKRLSDGADP